MDKEKDKNHLGIYLKITNEHAGDLEYWKNGLKNTIDKIDKYEVLAFYPDQSYDQSSWILEKTECALKSICRMIDKMHDSEKTKFEEDILYALYDLLKVYSFWAGYRDMPRDTELILKHGTDGFEHLIYTNSLTHKKDRFTKIEDDKKTEQEILSLLNVKERTNRTKIYDLLQTLNYKSEFIKTFYDDLEKVTMGENTWEWLVSKYTTKG